MNVYDAIDQMRKITKKHGTFSFSFMSYDSTRGQSKGIVTVPHARLRPRHQDMDPLGIMEAFVNTDNGEARNFYQPLLLTFNGQKCELQ